MKKITEIENGKLKGRYGMRNQQREKFFNEAISIIL